jgi:TolB-like protein/Tfp pilus assembly protein PilF
VEQRRCLDLPWGPFLHRFSTGSEPFDEWVASERARLAALATRAFAEVAERAHAAGDGEIAIRALERLVAIDPAEEERHRRLLSFEAKYRGVDAALGRAKALSALLKRELDLDPEPATLALVEDLRRQPGQREQEPADAEHRQMADGTTPPRIASSGASEGSNRPLMLVTAAIAALLIGSATLALVQMSEPRAPTAGTAVTGRLATDPSWASPAAVATDAMAAPDRSRGVVAIAVLPFTSLGEQGNGAATLAAMMTDDLTDVLSRIGIFRVISRQTASSFAGAAVDAAAVGAELGIRYLLEGSVASRGDVIRVNVSLTDARTRSTLWSGRFERAGSDRHGLEDEIVNALARELQVEVGHIESDSPSAASDVHALVFRGWRAIDAAGRSGVASIEEAGAHFRQALQRDPGNVRALHGLAAYHTHMAVQLYAPDPRPHMADALAILEKLLEQQPSNAGLHATLALLQIARRRFADAEHSFRRAVALNPSHAGAYAQLGRLLLRQGRPQQALEHVLYAIRLSPRDPLLAYWLGFAGAAELEQGRDVQAIEYLQRALAMNPNQPRTTLVMVAAHALTGNMQDARARLGRLQATLPHLSNDKLVQRFGPAGQTSRFSRGLRLALAAESSTP